MNTEGSTWKRFSVLRKGLIILKNRWVRVKTADGLYMTETKFLSNQTLSSIRVAKLINRLRMHQYGLKGTQWTIWGCFSNVLVFKCRQVLELSIQTENPLVDTRDEDLRKKYGAKLLPVENKADRKKIVRFTKLEEMWRLRFFRGVCLYEEREQGRDLSTKAKAHLKSFVLRHHSRVSYNGPVINRIVLSSLRCSDHEIHLIGRVARLASLSLRFLTIPTIVWFLFAITLA